MVRLFEVFGIHASLPSLTYVDRSGLDEIFTYYADASKHIVIHGPSKQGKTVLWKNWKNKSKDRWCIQIACTLDSTVQNLLAQILTQLGVPVPKNIESTLKIGTAEPVAKMLGAEFTRKQEGAFPDLDSELTHLVADSLTKLGARVIFEDFHYLSEDEQRKLSFILKGLGELHCFAMVVGVWPQQNLLTFYNGDLRGRVEEIDIKWSNNELLKVIENGAHHLNFDIDPDFANQVVADSYGNVGMLQRIMEKVCLKSGITQTLIGRHPQLIKDSQLLDKCREEICQGERVRYAPVLEILERGFKLREDGTDVYRNILNYTLKCPDSELMTGISYDSLLQGVLKVNPKTQQASLTQALHRLVPLQVNKKISPPILYYNRDSRKLYVTEPEFLFFRKYGIGKNEL